VNSRSTLTKIEMLDAQFPGLAEQVGQWFAQGVSAIQVAALIFERYQVSVLPGTVSSFRCRRWVPEQKRLREKMIGLRAAQQVAHEREVKTALAAEPSGERQ